MKNLKMEFELSESQLKEIYLWVDQFSFSRIKRNISRDFCDAVLVAEIIHAYEPHVIEIHNYYCTNNLKTKLQNWEILQNKVFKKIGLSINSQEIDGIINSRILSVENFLFKLKNTLENKNAQKENAKNLLKKSSQDFKNRQVPLVTQVQNVTSLKVINSQEAILNLTRAIEILSLKIEKTQQMLDLKDQKIFILEKTMVKKTGVF